MYAFITVILAINILVYLAVAITNDSLNNTLACAFIVATQIAALILHICILAPALVITILGGVALLNFFGLLKTKNNVALSVQILFVSINILALIFKCTLLQG